MKPLIAVSGKGGTGKSTLAALLVKALVAGGVRPVLAVDADPNACLAALLDVTAPGTVSELRDEVRAPKEVSEMPRAVLVEQKLNEIMAEGEGFDVLTMGNPEGPGCYCYVNSLLREGLKRLSAGYAAVVVDNQAGMEHLSRLVTAEITSLVLVSEPTVHAARAVRAILDLTPKLPMRIGRRILVWNKVPRHSAVPEAARAEAGSGADEVLEIPMDDALSAAYASGSMLGVSGDKCSYVERVLELSQIAFTRS